MPTQLSVSIGQHSDKGRKESNQDFHGVYIPEEPQLSAKGIAIALADGISSSKVSHIASQAAVTGFLTDYYCTSDAWSVKKAGQQVLTATNSWLHSQTRQSPYRYDKDRGYVCTFSAMVVKSTTAHIFHVGDARIYQLRGNQMEQLTEDHRCWISEEKSYLSRALGIDSRIELDYQTVALAKGDVYFLATDGVYEFVDTPTMSQIITENLRDLDTAAKILVDTAYQRGSDDNLTVQLLRIDELSEQNADDVYRQLNELPFPPMLSARMRFDGFRIIRELHGSSRSHVYLAENDDSRTPVVIKTPSIDLRSDPAYLERFLLEEWIARRIDSAHVLKPCLQARKRQFLYWVTEFIDGQTLAQWLIDNPKPTLETVRGMIEQIAKGLRAFHRLEMLHQDLRPDNIMIDRTGTVKIIDFGSTSVAGLMEGNSAISANHLLGTAQYSAPEYFLGQAGSTRSDLFSLGVLAYQMLSGRLPYGAEVAKTRSKAAQKKLIYRSLLDAERGIPIWVDEAIRKAVHPNPFQRYQELSEFIYDLRHPNQSYLLRSRPPLLDRDPTFFWKTVSLALLITNLTLLYFLVT